MARGRFWRGAAACLGFLFVGGCASSGGPSLDTLSQEVNRLQADASTLAKDQTSQKYLATSRTLETSSTEQKKNDLAVQDMMEAEGAARTSLMAAVAGAREVEAKECRSEADRARREWQDSLQMLANVEDTAGRKARGVERKAPPLPDPDTLPPLPPSPTGSTLDTTSVLRSLEGWAEAGRQGGVPVADLENRALPHLAIARNPKTDPALRDYHLRMADWATTELAYRVRAEAARRLCRTDSEAALQFNGNRDKALWAMVDLERGLKERTASREQDLYRSLQQFEGKFASLHQTARGTILSLSDILFDTGKAALRTEARINLAKVSVVLQQFPEMRIRIEGHTDNVGSEEFNMKLSQARAQTVFDFLVEQDVDGNRMMTEGFGLSQPVAPNDTPEGRQQNRRVDLVIAEEDGGQ
jgi:outer membrane protein OmpA-like peptidoglycan-associated protein